MSKRFQSNLNYWWRGIKEYRMIKSIDSGYYRKNKLKIIILIISLIWRNYYKIISYKNVQKCLKNTIFSKSSFWNLRRMILKNWRSRVWDIRKVY